MLARTCLEPSLNHCFAIRVQSKWVVVASFTLIACICTFLISQKPRKQTGVARRTTADSTEGGMLLFPPVQIAASVGPGADPGANISSAPTGFDGGMLLFPPVPVVSASSNASAPLQSGQYQSSEGGMLLFPPVLMNDSNTGPTVQGMVLFPPVVVALPSAGVPTTLQATTQITTTTKVSSTTTVLTSTNETVVAASSDKDDLPWWFWMVMVVIIMICCYAIFVFTMQFALARCKKREAESLPLKEDVEKDQEKKVMEFRDVEAKVVPMDTEDDRDSEQRNAEQAIQDSEEIAKLAIAAEEEAAKAEEEARKAEEASKLAAELAAKETEEAEAARKSEELAKAAEEAARLEAIAKAEEAERTAEEAKKAAEEAAFADDANKAGALARLAEETAKAEKAAIEEAEAQKALEIAKAEEAHRLALAEKETEEAVIAQEAARLAAIKASEEAAKAEEAARLESEAEEAARVAAIKAAEEMARAEEAPVELHKISLSYENRTTWKEHLQRWWRSVMDSVGVVDKEEFKSKYPSYVQRTYDKNGEDVQLVDVSDLSEERFPVTFEMRVTSKSKAVEEHARIKARGSATSALGAVSSIAIANVMAKQEEEEAALKASEELAMAKEAARLAKVRPQWQWEEEYYRMHLLRRVPSVSYAAFADSHRLAAEEQLRAAIKGASLAGISSAISNAKRRNVPKDDVFVGEVCRRRHQAVDELRSLLAPHQDLQWRCLLVKKISVLRDLIRRAADDPSVVLQEVKRLVEETGSARF